MKKKIVYILIAVIFLSGLCVFCFPYANHLFDYVRSEHRIEAFTTEKEALADKTDSTVLPELYRALSDYNVSLYAGHQQSFSNATAYDSFSVDLTAYGLDDDVLGYLKIPAMDIELPLYLGANKENMAKGAAVLGETSAPLGGANTNCVIAAHRGYRGTPKFRNIQKLAVGDPVYISTYWGDMTYQVVETKIILPNEINEVMIKDGRDLVTLITCHPYRHNTHRYVVLCERVG